MAANLMARLPLSVKLFFGFGQAAEGIKNFGFSIFLLFYYNSVLGLPGWMSGLAVGIALVFDAITDPLAGSLSDRTRTSLGRRHPYMYASIIPLAIGFYLLFTPPTGLSQWQLFGWMLCFAVLTRAGMTLFHVPHLSLGAELTDDFAERTSVVSARQIFSTLGSMFVIFAGFGIFFVATTEQSIGQFRLEQYGPFALAMAICMAVSIGVSALGTQARAKSLSQPAPSKEVFSLPRIFKQLWIEILEALSNDSFRWMFFGILCIFFMVGVEAALGLHMNTYFWELSETGNLLFFVAAPVGLIVGAFFTRRLNERFDKKPCVMLGTGGWAFCQFAMITLRLLDIMPANGTSELLYILVTFKFVQGLFVAQSLITFGSMVADIVDEHQLKSGRRQEGIFFAAVSFSSKCTTGLGSAMAGVALSIIGFPDGVGGGDAVVVAPETVRNLGIFFGPGISGLAIVSVWCMSHHNLDRARHAEVQQELAQSTAAPMSDSLGLQPQQGSQHAFNKA